MGGFLFIQFNPNIQTDTKMANYQNPMAKCKVYTIQASPCDCILILQDTVGRNTRIPLRDAVTYSFQGGFSIQSPITGVKVDSASGFTQNDIDILICTCQSSLGGETSRAVSAGRVLLTGAGSWTAPADLQSMSYAVIATGNPGVTPTITTTSGTGPLVLDEQAGFSVTKNDTDLVAPLTVTTSSGDQVLITFTLYV
jgi:hypothetical protein